MMDAGWYLLGCDRPPAGTKLPVRRSWSHTPWTSQFAKQVESENGIEPNNSEMKTNSPSWNNKTVKATMIDIIKHRLLSALSKTQQSLRPQKHLNRFSVRPRSRRSPAVFCSRWIAKTKQKIETLLMAHFSFADEGSTMKHYVALRLRFVSQSLPFNHVMAFILLLAIFGALVKSEVCVTPNDFDNFSSNRLVSWRLQNQQGPIPSLPCSKIGKCCSLRSRLCVTGSNTRGHEDLEPRRTCSLATMQVSLLK